MWSPSGRRHGGLRPPTGRTPVLVLHARVGPGLPELPAPPGGMSARRAASHFGDSEWWPAGGAATRASSQWGSQAAWIRSVPGCGQCPLIGNDSRRRLSSVFGPIPVGRPGSAVWPAPAMRPPLAEHLLMPRVWQRSRPSRRSPRWACPHPGQSARLVPQPPGLLLPASGGQPDVHLVSFPHRERSAAEDG